VAPGTDEAQRQRELTKQALAQSAGRLEQRVRAELDWKARLRRDGPRYAAIGGAAILLVGTLVIVRARLRGKKAEEEVAPMTLEDIATELPGYVAAAEPDTIVLGPASTIRETLAADGAVQLVAVLRSLPEAPSTVAALWTRGKGGQPLSWSPRNWLSRTN